MSNKQKHIHMIERNEYLDLSNELHELKTRKEFYEFLPKVLPFLAKYCNSRFAQYLIDDVAQLEQKFNAVPVNEPVQ